MVLHPHPSPPPERGKGQVLKICADRLQDGSHKKDVRLDSVVTQVRTGIQEQHFAATCNHKKWSYPKG